MNLTITPDHWIAEATRIPYPAGPAMPVRRFLIFHFTSGATALSSIEFWKTPAAKGAEAHLVIDRDGTILQIRPFNQTADHAGTSRWKDPNTGKEYHGLNTCSIGIELANAGDNGQLRGRWSKLSPLKAAHKNGGPVTSWEQYTPEQITTATALAQALTQRYHVDDIAGHDDIAPDRKNDPGPAFPMAQIRAAAGFLRPLAKL